MIWQRNLCIAFLFLFSVFVGANGFFGNDVLSVLFFPFYYVAIYLEIKFSRVFIRLSDKYAIIESVVAKDPFLSFSKIVHEPSDFNLAVKTYKHWQILRLVEGELVVFYMFTLALLNDAKGVGVLISGGIALFFFLNWWHEWRKMETKEKVG